jgi:predicted acetyltransferase
MAHTVALERVAAAHAVTYREMVTEFLAAGEGYPFNDVELARRDFDAYVADLDAEAAGVGLPPGIVPQTTYALVEPDGTVVGEFRYRPTAPEPYEQSHGHVGYNVRPSRPRRGYATAGLRALLVIAAHDGLPGLLAPIAPGNAASIRVVTACGGHLLRRASRGAGDEDLSFWIPTQLQTPV